MCESAELLFLPLFGRVQVLSVKPGQITVGFCKSLHAGAKKWGYEGSESEAIVSVKQGGFGDCSDLCSSVSLTLWLCTADQTPEL